MTLGEKLKSLREEKGYMQRDVARELDIAPNTLSGYETDNRKPDSETLKKLSDYYNVSIDYLLGSDLMSDDELPENIRAVARDLMELPEENRKLAIDMIKMMSQRGKEAKKK
jgi:transcriptional regulator with XRE-family HTH domain